MAAGSPPPGRLIEVALWVVVVLGLGAILSLAKDALVPLALATLLSFALSPVVRALQKLGLPRGVGAVVALAMFMATIGVWVWFVSAQVSDLAERLPAYRHNIDDKVQALALGFGHGKSSRLLAEAEDLLKEVAPAGPPKAAQRVVVVDNSPFSRLSLWGAFASPLLSPLAQFVIVLAFTAFLLAQKEDLRNRLIRLIGPRDIYRTTEAIDDAGRRIGRMLFAQFVMNGAFGLLIALALWAIGVPNPALWGALAAISRFVPYLGVVIGLAPPLIVAFAVDPGWTSFLMTLALFVAAESVTGQIVEPIVYGHSSGLSPTAVVVAASVWALLWGTIGLVLATPLTTCLVVLGRHAPGLGFLEILLGDAPPLSPHETFYQRMLAGDPRDAAAQARPYLRRNAVADYYDEVALEALRRAQVDVARGDLDPARLKALTRSTRMLVALLGGHGFAAGGWRRLAWRGGRETQAPPAPAGKTVAVLHGEHPLDPLAASMLTHALTHLGLQSRVVTMEEARMASAAECAAVGLVCLCYIDALTIAHLRAAAVAARRRCPQARVMICLWRDPADTSFSGLERKLRCDGIATSVGAAAGLAMRLLRLSAAPWAPG